MSVKQQDHFMGLFSLLQGDEIHDWSGELCQDVSSNYIKIVFELGMIAVYMNMNGFWLIYSF